MMLVVSLRARMASVVPRGAQNDGCSVNDCANISLHVVVGNIARGEVILYSAVVLSRWAYSFLCHFTCGKVRIGK